MASSPPPPLPPALPPGGVPSVTPNYHLLYIPTMLQHATTWPAGLYTAVSRAFLKPTALAATHHTGGTCCMLYARTCRKRCYRHLLAAASYTTAPGAPSACAHMAARHAHFCNLAPAGVTVQNAVPIAGRARPAYSPPLYALTYPALNAACHAKILHQRIRHHAALLRHKRAMLRARARTCTFLICLGGKEKEGGRRAERKERREEEISLSMAYGRAISWLET